MLCAIPSNVPMCTALFSSTGALNQISSQGPLLLLRHVLRVDRFHAPPELGLHLEPRPVVLVGPAVAPDRAHVDEAHLELVFTILRLRGSHQCRRNGYSRRAALGFRQRGKAVRCQIVAESSGTMQSPPGSQGYPS